MQKLCDIVVTTPVCAFDIVLRWLPDSWHISIWVSAMSEAHHHHFHVRLACAVDSLFIMTTKDCNQMHHHLLRNNYTMHTTSSSSATVLPHAASETHVETPLLSESLWRAKRCANYEALLSGDRLFDSQVCNTAVTQFSNPTVAVVLF